VLDEARGLVTKRLAELDDERKRLERALAELGGSGKKAGRRPGRPRGSTSKSKTRSKSTTSKSTGTAKKARRRRKRRSGGTRADQAVTLIRQNPGITASEIAKQMKIKPNYLYRVLSDLEKQKSVKKKGRTYSAA
jgi:ribosome-binding protein aMBF1 (putative translation factor)